MPLNQLALLELTGAMRTADDGKLMRTLLHTILQALVDAEATGHIEAGMHEQNDTRTTQRNGTRTNVVSATSGDLSVRSPRPQDSRHGVIIRECSGRVLTSQERCRGSGFGRRSGPHPVLSSGYGPSVGN